MPSPADFFDFAAISIFPLVIASDALLSSEVIAALIRRPLIFFADS